MTTDLGAVLGAVRPSTRGVHLVALPATARTPGQCEVLRAGKAVFVEALWPSPGQEGWPVYSAANRGQRRPARWKASTTSFLFPLPPGQEAVQLPDGWPMHYLVSWAASGTAAVHQRAQGSGFRGRDGRYPGGGSWQLLRAGRIPVYAVATSGQLRTTSRSCCCAADRSTILIAYVHHQLAGSPTGRRWTSRGRQVLRLGGFVRALSVRPGGGVRLAARPDRGPVRQAGRVHHPGPLRTGGPMPSAASAVAGRRHPPSHPLAGVRAGPGPPGAPVTCLAGPVT